MKQVLPGGFNHEQWTAVTKGLEDHPSTMNDYRKIINLFYSWNDSNSIIHTSRSTAQDYFDYLDTKAKNGEMSSNTVHRYQATLRAVGSRMEANPDVFQDFHNPFAGILHNETRKKTTFETKTFADPADIAKLIAVIPTFPLKKQLVLEMMTWIGLRPYHIENLHCSDFKRNPNQPDELIMTFMDGYYVKKFNHYEKPRPSMCLDSVSMNGNETYRILAGWKFFASYSKHLLEYHPNLGSDDSHDLFFTTVRNQPYGYRPIHNLVQEACGKANLEPCAVTPYQLSLYGTIHSKLIFDSLQRQKDIKDTISHARSRVEKNLASSQLRNENDTFLKLVEYGWIGGWTPEYPKNREILIHDITRQMGKESLLKITGIE